MDPNLVNSMKAGTTKCATVHISSRHGNISIVIQSSIQCHKRSSGQMRLQVRDEDLQLQYECNLGNSTSVFLKTMKSPFILWSGSKYGQKASVAFLGPDKPGYPEKDKVMKKKRQKMMHARGSLNGKCPMELMESPNGGSDGACLAHLYHDHAWMILRMWPWYLMWKKLEPGCIECCPGMFGCHRGPE